MGGILYVVAAIDCWGLATFMAAICCMMCFWLDDRWLMAAVTLAVIVATVEKTSLRALST